MVLSSGRRGIWSSVIAIFLIATFFIISADSATFVLGTLTTHGNLNPPNSIKFTWGVIQSVAAAVLLWSGGLKGLQTGAILAAFPFAFIILIYGRRPPQIFEAGSESPKGTSFLRENSESPPAYLPGYWSFFFAAKPWIRVRLTIKKTLW